MTTSTLELKTILENMIDVVVILDMDGVFLTVSPSIRWTLGYEPADMTGTICFDYLFPDDRDRVVRTFRRTLETDRQTESFRFRHADGRFVWLETAARAVWKGIDLQGIVVSARDITDRKAAEAKLRRSEQQYRLLVENTMDYVARIHLDGTVLFVSDAVESILGHLPTEIVGGHFLDFVHPEDRASADRIFQQALAEGKQGSVECRLRGKDGLYRWMEVRGKVFRNDLTGRLEIISVSRDVTARVEMEQALRRAEKEYRDIFNNALAAIYRSVPEGRLVMANETAARILGYSSAVELIQSVASIGDQIYQDGKERERVIGLLENQDSCVVEIPYRHVNGSITWSVHHIRAVRDESGRILHFDGVAQDITEQKKAEENLRMTLNSLEDLVRERTVELHDVNTALRVLLDRSKEDQRILEERLRQNVNELLMPILDELRSCGLNEKGILFLDLLQSNLREITSPFLSRLTSSCKSLTPREIEVAGMIREGKKTKQIAELLGISAVTVDTHRINIRTKLGLSGEKVNLRSHLLSMA
ncbi:MAG: PAS domain-containing protein [Syntrophales bacterium]